MATINAKVVNVRMVETEDGIVYRVTFDTKFDGIIKRDGEYVEDVVDYINFIPRVLIAQIIDKVGDLGVIYSHIKETAIVNGGEPFTAAVLSAYIAGSAVTLEREKFAAGSEYTNNKGETLTHEHDGYSTDIVEVKLSDKGQARVDKKVDAILGF